MWPNKFKNTRFKERGRDYSGIDCWGVVYLIYRDLLNIELPLYTDEYQSTQDIADIASLIADERPNWVTVPKPKEFDVILFRVSGEWMHVGLYYKDGLFVHCLDKSGVSVEKLSSPVWRHRIVGYHRHADRQ